MIDKIVEECGNNNLKVEVENRNGEQAYRVFGFSKSGSALLYMEDDIIICQTRYGQTDHVLTFSDLVLVAKSWYEEYKDRSPFENPEPEWKPIFENIFINTSRNSNCDEDLPF